MIEIHELQIPTAVGAAGWADFVTADDIRFAAEALIYGTDELALTAEEDLPSWLDYENEPTRMFVARDGGRIVGSASYESEPGDDPQTVWLRVDVLPGYRRRGIGTALARTLEQIASTDGVRKAIAYTVSAEAPGERIEAPTGFGSVPAGNPEVQFLLGNGFRLEQVERCSRLALPIETTPTLDASLARLSDDFAVHTWVDYTPPQWRVDMANLRQRMSTEEPGAGLDEPEDLWSVDRLVEHEERLDMSPRTSLTAAVEYKPTGRLVGFTTLSVPAEVRRAVSQEDTLVLPEQRGHALGMLLKLTNLDQLQRLFPGHPSITTFNAEENRHMLDVNEAIGFVPIGHEGAWRTDLPH
jgi:GNAT superfamily N-acetyltransferase